MTDTADPALERLRYPVGRFEPPSGPLPAATRTAMIDEIAAVPAALRAAVAPLADDVLDTPYRPGGWTIRQVVHHVPDSHMNAYVRFKLAMTEEHPTIRTYDETAWGELADAREADIALSLSLLEALHARWTGWLRTLGEADWRRGFDHPEMGALTLDQLLALYAWHGRHHLAHVTGLLGRLRVDAGDTDPGDG